MKKTQTRIWSLLLTAAMLLSMLPSAALAEGVDEQEESAAVTEVQEEKSEETAGVAKVGEETFDTLAEAIAAAKDGDTVELLGNASIDDSNPEEGAAVCIKSDIALEGNSYTITAKGFTKGYDAFCILVAVM